MSCGAATKRVLIITHDPSLRELFLFLFDGWQVQVVRDLKALGKDELPFDLLVIDEDRLLEEDRWLPERLRTAQVKGSFPNCCHKLYQYNIPLLEPRDIVAQTMKNSPKLHTLS